LASVSLSRLQLLASERRRGAAAALYMKDEIERSLAVVQLGITLVGLIAGATGGASATDDLAPLLVALGIPPRTAAALAVALVVLPLTAVTIVIGELIPKLFALRNKEWVVLRLSPIMRSFTWSAWPVVWLLEASASSVMDLSEKFWRPQPHADARTEAAELQELRAIASLARTSRLIGPREENIILGAARLASRTLREILLPAEHIRMLYADDPLVDSLVAAHLDMHTRFPVTERRDDPQAIIGYVTFKDIVAVLKLSPHEPSLRGILRRIPQLDQNLVISAALEKLLREHTHIALVTNEQGTNVGLVTLEDIVEELIGDIQDEYDLLPVHVIRSGPGWVVGGGVTLGRLKELTGVELPADGQAHNLSGWIINRLPEPPEGGEVVKAAGQRLLVRKIRRQRVLEALISPEVGPHSEALHPGTPPAAVAAGENQRVPG
jgi:putative hemolysin